MDFALNEEQEAIRDLAKQILEGYFTKIHPLPRPAAPAGSPGPAPAPAAPAARPAPGGAP